MRANRDTGTITAGRIQPTTSGTLVFSEHRSSTERVRPMRSSSRAKTETVLAFVSGSDSERSLRKAFQLRRKLSDKIATPTAQRATTHGSHDAIPSGISSCTAPTIAMDIGALLSPCITTLIGAGGLGSAVGWLVAAMSTGTDGLATATACAIVGFDSGQCITTLTNAHASIANIDPQ